jgi:hypothetical protein
MRRCPVPELLSLETWRQQLAHRGHLITAPDQTGVTTFGLCPGPDTIITVAVDPDVTLRTQYRQRYFLCACEPERVFRLAGCPEPHRSRWLDLLARQPEGYWHDFLAGPGAWTLARLTRFREVIAWSERGLDWPGLDDPTHRQWGLDVPSAAAPFFSAAARGPEVYRPHLFASGDEHFADVVAACFLFASVGTRDCYLADAEGMEVYRAHHHDKVVVSIPDGEVRDAVVREITEAAWLFEDVSGYVFSGDEDQGPDD